MAVVPIRFPALAPARSSVRTRVLASVLRRAANQVTNRRPDEIRDSLNRLARWTPNTPGVARKSDRLAGLPTRWAVPRAAHPDDVLLHFHGGGYATCSLDTHHMLLGELARATGTRTVAVEYRKAPEFAFPVPIDDCVRGYRALLKRGVPAHRIVLSGDSAGGGLALAVVQRLRAEGMPMPKGLVLLSPWVDLAVRGHSIDRYERFDYLNRRSLEHFAELYLQGADPEHPEASACNADFSDFPPMLIQAGGSEVLRSEIERMAARADAQGVDVRLEVWDGMFHTWQGFTAFLPEARSALSSIGRFVNSL